MLVASTALASTAPVTLASRKLPATADGRLQLRVVCHAAAEKVCRGTLNLTWRVAQKRRSVGHAQFTIAGRTTGVVTIVLNSKQRRTLRQARTLAGTTTIVARAGSARVRTATAVVIRTKR
jgi:hypothetical protein